MILLNRSLVDATTESIVSLTRLKMLVNFSPNPSVAPVSLSNKNNTGLRVTNMPLNTETPTFFSLSKSVIAVVISKSNNPIPVAAIAALIPKDAVRADNTNPLNALEPPTAKFLNPPTNPFNPLPRLLKDILFRIFNAAPAILASLLNPAIRSALVTNELPNRLLLLVPVLVALFNFSCSSAVFFAALDASLSASSVSSTPSLNVSTASVLNASFISP